MLQLSPFRDISISTSKPDQNGRHFTNDFSGAHSWLKLRFSLLWRHNGRGGVPNDRPHDFLLNRRGSKTTSKLRVTGLCEGNSPVAGEFPARRASYAEKIFISWRHYVKLVPKGSVDNMSAVERARACWPQAANHYMIQIWTKFMTLYGHDELADESYQSWF